MNRLFYEGIRIRMIIQITLENEPYFIKHIEVLRKSYPQHKFVLDKEKGPCDYIVAGRMTIDEVKNNPRLKGILVPYTGKNGLPLDVLKERGIQVFNSHGKAHIVAERAVAMTLTLMGRIMELDQKLRKGTWVTREHWGKEFWTTLQNKKVGFYGYGHIGKAIHRLLKGFNIKAYTLKRRKKEEGIHLLDSLDELCERVDVLYIAVPLNDKTQNTLRLKQLQKLKGYVINVARGNIMNEKDLYNALKNQIIPGAGIDAWYQYPSKEEKIKMPSQYPFEDLENIVMSPHAASHAKETWTAYYDDTIEQIEKILEGNEEEG